jgi:hypothetical protein
MAVNLGQRRDRCHGLTILWRRYWMLLMARLVIPPGAGVVVATRGVSDVPYLLGGLVLAWQVACGIHVVRTGRQLYWLWIIIIAPFLGSLIYTLVEMGPEIMRSRQAATAHAKAVSIIDPDRRLRALMDELDTVETAQNKHAVAEEYMRRNEPQKALPLLQSAATGLYSDDPMILMTLAQAQFGCGRFQETTATLDHLKEKNPKFENADGHLLYARSLEAQGRNGEARGEYAAVINYFPGAEARVRYGLFLQQQGDPAEAKRVFQEVVRSFEKAGKVFIRDQREWYDIAKRNS